MRTQGKLETSAVAAKVAATAIAALTLAVPASAVTVVGTQAGETIHGTARADDIRARGGNDRIFAAAGRDFIDGGAGSDRIDAGAGNDLVRARDRARDVVSCGPGQDRAIVDTLDVVRGCEAVIRPSLRAPTTPSPIAVENARPGSPGWARFELAPKGTIEGYTEPSAAPGETLTFHVSTDPEADYRIAIYRMGYYDGAGARLAACLPSCEGRAHGQPERSPSASAEGLVHAGWPDSQRLDVPGDWVSGYYLVHFVLMSGPQEGKATTTWFILREAPETKRAPILVQASPTTWQAYNGWGGGSLYEFNSPDGRRATKIAFDRPYDQPLEQRPEALELPLVRFLERNGYDVAYQADVDTARDPGSLDRRKLIAVAGHSEYWSKEMRDGFERARAAGTNLAFFAANAAYWQVRFEENFRTIVGYKSAAADPETDPRRETTMFRELVPPRYECELMGVQHAGGTLAWTMGGDYTVSEAAAGDPWIRAAGLHPGDVLSGIVSREVDTIPGNQSALDSCGNRLTVLFHRELGTAEQGDADAVKFIAPSGAKVFASGSHQFVWGLEDVPEVERMSHNLVDPRLQAFARAMLDDMLST
jgi:Ca2+-binding RTX toxin-like protein